MNALVQLLPKAWRPKAKAIVGAVMTALTVLSSTLPAVPSWVTVTLGVLTALSVYAAPAPGYVGPPVE